MKKETIMKKTRTNTGFNGITKRGENRFEAWFIAKPGNKFHIGSFKTLPDAVSNRTDYITNLI